MHFFLHLTTRCDLNCKYCAQEALEDLKFGKRRWELDYPPPEVSYEVRDLKGFLKKDDDPWVIFYGGEPLLKTDLIKEIMDEIRANYIIQTNGVRLKELGDYVRRFHTIILSIDGKKETTDYFRGKGVYDKVIKSARWAREMGFEGELIARMTVMEPVDVKEEVLHLLNLGLFDSVHWQLNALFWEDLERRNFKEWLKDYNKGVRELINLWVENMKKGKVWRIYPFLGVMDSLLRNEPSLLRCGAGWAQYAILTDGNISPCVAMAGMKEYYVGNIWESDPKNLKKVLVGEPCTSCDIYPLCGGRCLFANKTKLWGEEGFKLVCTSVRNLISSLQEKLPEVRSLIQEGKIKLSHLNYHKFNSCEIIP